MKQMGKNDRQIKYVHKKTDDAVKRAGGEKVKEDGTGGAAQSNTLESGDKWIQKAHVKKGGLHKALHVPQDETIPKSKIEKASHSKNAHLKHMAQFAKNVANEGGAGGIHGKFPDPMSAKDQHKKMNPPASLEEDDMMEFIKSKLAPAKTRQANGMKHANAHGGLEFEDADGPHGKPGWLIHAEKDAEGIDESGPTRKHFQQVADKVRQEPDPEMRRKLAGHHAEIFKQQNPRFNHEIFNRACGVDLDECDWAAMEGQEMDEGWDDAMALGKAAANQKPAFSRHDVKDTGYSKVYTRKPETFDEPEGDEIDPNAPKRGRGRPKSTKPVEKRVTKGAYKHKVAEEGEEMVDEKAEQGKRHFFDKLAPAAKKVAKVVSKVTAGKKEEAPKKDKSAEKKEAPKKDKKEEKVEETTTAGSVATSGATHPAAKAMGVGQGVYESINSEVEKLIAESFNLEMNKGISDAGETDSGITITADGEDADMLKDLLKSAGIDLHGHSHELGDEHSEEPCGSCGGVPCQCDDMGGVEVVGEPTEIEFEVDEAYGDTDPTENDELSWPTNQMTTGMNQSMDPISNDLNKNKTSGQEVGAVTPVNQVKEADESTSFLNLYKAFAKIK